MVNINDYLFNDEAKEYHNEVIKCCNFISNALNLNYVIYGGYIRTIIENYHEKKFKKPSDIDIWLFPKGNEKVSCTISNKWILEAFHYDKEKLSEKTHPYHEIYKINDFELKKICYKDNMRCINPIQYCFFTIIVDNINFDVSLEITSGINDEKYYLFHEICDYSINNIYLKSNDEFEKRCKTDFTIDETINHIKDRELHEIYDYDLLEKNMTFQKMKD